MVNETKNTKKQMIRENLSKMAEGELEFFKTLKKKAIITDYEKYTFLDKDNKRIWSFAFQKAIDENEILIIPAATEPYYMDRTVVIPSNRMIKADSGAVIRQKEDVKVLMIRNRNVVDGTHNFVRCDCPDKNIMICGGIWEEADRGRLGYGRSGMIDEDRSFYGVCACMFFSNIEGLVLKDLVFVHTGGFAIQCGYAKNLLIENIRFRKCYVDGVHINGNTENAIVRNISGQVGDDLVALNMYDWLNSSVCFGPGRNILCEDIVANDDSHYQAMRILTGIYYFDNGDSIDCSIGDLIISRAKGIKTYKLYFQTPAYKIGEDPERGGVGNCQDIFFENIEIVLDGPADRFDEYLNGDKIRGSFAAFELGANIESLDLENIDLKLDKNIFPMGFLCCAGPKSIIRGEKEIFDPYISCTVKEVNLKVIKINGSAAENIEEFIKEIDFTGFGGKGVIEKVNFER